VAVVIVVGDGPGGLSAALFLAKNGQDVIVFGDDKTAMHYALLRNYLGIPEMTGTEFQEVARTQVAGFGARIIDARVDSIAPDGSGFSVTAGAAEHTADYLILTEGKNPVLAEALGLEPDPAGGVATDRDGRTSVDRVYAVGRTARPARSQAIISAGAGAAAALDILARESGQDVQDWDSPPKE
jgi:thioredoxin reductase